MLWVNLVEKEGEEQWVNQAPRVSQDQWALQDLKGQRGLLGHLDSKV